MATPQHDGAPSHRSIHALSILQTNVTDLLNRQIGRLTHLIRIRGSFNLGCCSAASVSSEIQGHRPSETNPEQLLGHDQSRTNQPVI